MKLVVHVDGGARGNPGPAAAAAVLSTPDGEVVDEAHELLGGVTNNVAEYRGLLLGLARARELGADEVEVVNDSELVAKQVNGIYKVKHPDMRPLHRQAMEALRDFARWRVRSVPRAQNADADALVNQALDARPVAEGRRLPADTRGYVACRVRPCARSSSSRPDRAHQPWALVALHRRHRRGPRLRRPASRSRPRSRSRAPTGGAPARCSSSAGS